MPEKNFKFLEERPLQTTEEFSNSKFGHEEIANTLVNITKNCPTPFTVGLFAKWGSGKSTVANSLLKKLPKEKVPVVLFDVWKHEGDALRRTFLKETVRQLKEFGNNFFDASFELDEKLEQSVSRTSESRFVFPKEKLMHLKWPIIIGLALIGLLGWIAEQGGYFEFYKYFLTVLFGSATAGSFLLWLAKQAMQMFTTETVNYGVDKFGDPHQFEQEFGRILRALKNPRVLIIFDNLDRVMHDKVAEVLSTVKTFLEPQDIENEKREVVFLVPCDAKAIKQHISSVYNPADKGIKNSAFDPDEFLRKFFNTIVWIPDFIPSELESFARSRLKETGVLILDNDYVAWIITKAFRNNPRQVIQFTNILLANYLLVNEREGADKDFPDGFLNGNIPQLTKYLILNQLFPEEMDVLREKKVLDLNEVKDGDLNTSTKKQFLAFVEETKNIPISDLRTFFTLRRSEQEKKFPGFDTFIANLEDRNTADSKKYMDQIGDLSKPELTSDLSQALKKELESKANPVSTINLTHTLFEVLEEKKTALSSTLYEEINNILGSRCKEELHTIQPELLNNAFLTKNSKYIGNVIPQWITVMEEVTGNGKKYKTDGEFVKTVLSIFALQPNYLSSTQTAKVKESILANLISNLDIAKIITQSPQVQTTLGSPEYVRGFTGAIPNGGSIDDISSRVEIINKFQDTQLTAAGGDFLVKKFTELITSENQNTKPESYSTKPMLLDQFSKFIRSHQTVFSAAAITSRDAFAESINVTFGALPDHQIRSIFVPILFELRSFVSDSKKGEIERSVSNWIGSVSPNSFEATLQLLQEEDQKSFLDVQLIYDSSANRSISDQAFREKFFSLLIDSRRNQFIEKILNSDFDKAFDFFESLKGKDIKSVFAVFDKIWTKFDTASPAQKQRLLKFVNSNKANNEVSVREVLANKIIACLVTVDPAIQQIGLEAFRESTLSKDLRRKIVKESFDWLKKPEVAPKYQSHTINAVVLGYNEFNQEEKNEFTHFLFDEIIRKSGKQSHIVGTLGVLPEIKPKYEERKTNFDDIKSRIESEQNQDIKKTLIEGIYNLMPAKTSKDNEEYWLWIEQEKSKFTV